MCDRFYVNGLCSVIIKCDIHSNGKYVVILDHMILDLCINPRNPFIYVWTIKKNPIYESLWFTHKSPTLPFPKYVILLGFTNYVGGVRTILVSKKY
jgi:hypothetical protein